VGDGNTLGYLVWLLIGLVVASALITGFQHYLLQRTGEGVVLSSRRRLVGRILRPRALSRPLAGPSPSSALLWP
jgi:ATP-binding cassette subfamily B protein